MTVEEIITAAATPLGLDFADIAGDASLLAQFLGYVNDALRSIERRGDWRFLFVHADRNTTADQDWVAIGEDFAAWQPDGRIYYVNAGFVKPNYLPPDAFNRLRSGAPTGGGYATYYTESFDAYAAEWRVLLYPTPADTHLLRIPYVRHLGELTDTTKTPPIPGPLLSTLKLGAMAEAEEQREKVAEGAQRGKFREALERDWALFGSPVRDQRRQRLCRAGADREAPVGDIEDNVIFTVRTPTP